MEHFREKRDVLSACLDNASMEIRGTVLDQKHVDLHTIETLICTNMKIERRGPPLLHMRGKESIFKKPELPLARCLKPRKPPDYQVNPHKWKRYSLDDVDISDRTNAAAALECLKQIDDRRQVEESVVVAVGEAARIEFKKSSKIRRDMKPVHDNELLDSEVDRPILRGFKVIMPEYVIGQTPAKAQVATAALRLIKPKSSKRRNVLSDARVATGVLRLTHLMEEDDDNDDESVSGVA